MMGTELAERAEVSPLGIDDAIARLPRDVTLLKIEQESIMAAAAARPRDHRAILADIKSQLETYRAFAETALYSKPIGDKKYATGLSIRAAEALAVAYGGLSVSSDVQPQAGGARVEARVVDYVTQRVWKDAGFISQSYTDRYKKRQTWNDDRFWNVVVKAEVSRRIRECIVRMVPPGLRAELQRIAEEQLNQFLDEKTANQILGRFGQYGLSREQLEAHMGKRIDSFTQQDRVTLLNLWNGLRDGETSVKDIAGEDHVPAGNGDGPKPLAEQARAVAAKLQPDAPPAPQPGPAPTEALIEEPPAVPGSGSPPLCSPKLYDRVRAAYDKLSGAARDEVRAAWNIKLIADVRKWDADAAEALIESIEQKG